MISFKIGKYTISRKAILIFLLGCFLTGIMIGVNMASKAFSTPIVFLFILPIWFLLLRGIKSGISKDK
ncbi:hypothetical protein [Ancylomarina sp. 16SWW S1-10-2]|uniref:hypothetical protein n=1 Tax=Ancylomarina sp. 16SWW S1-10-2 TaxID=2499681 RepID=UPI0012AE2A96|nr:hypothetical protein [Ancylomarina sp. 16SWW S1-10-2]MRT94001.1 hypothetical protein [Ancylomarina sp. 16SWW S1-10-2]